MSHFTIYHNPRCSKSRQTLELLRHHHVEPRQVLYLDTPPSVSELKKLTTMLGISARDLLRKGEEDYKKLDLINPAMSEKQLLTAMHQYPKLIERPIVACGNHAVLGRPPENVLSLLENLP